MSRLQVTPTGVKVKEGLKGLLCGWVCSICCCLHGWPNMQPQNMKPPTQASSERDGCSQYAQKKNVELLI